MNIRDLKNIIQNEAKTVTNEAKRLFHGRGAFYENFKYLCIDSLDEVLHVSLYFKEADEEKILDMVKEFALKHPRYKTLIIQRRYQRNTPSEIVFGDIPDNLHAIENGIKFKINLLTNQNTYYFADMKNGRAFIRNISKDKRVLNLFAYTCGFSVAAKLGGAKSVVNVDMSKGALRVGMANHHLNGIDTKGVSFLSYNILKSFSNIKKKSPFDIIIIDPPTFQKGSFDAKKDYEKIIKKLPQISNQNCTLLACLNSPELGSNFLIELVSKFAPSFIYKKKLPNPPDFPNKNDENGLKVLLFQRAIDNN